MKIKQSNSTSGNRGYIKYPGEDWKEVRINDYKDLQKMIGGFFQIVPINDKLTLYCDEEGKLKELEANLLWLDNGSIVDVLVGPVILLGPVDSEGNHTDATPKILKQLERHCIDV